MRRFTDPEVAAAFGSYPSAIRKKLLAVRELVFDTAAKTAGVGPLEESLRWGEPAYLTTASGSGSTIRIAWKESRPNEYAMYFNCKTNLVPSFRRTFSGKLHCEGNRALVFAARARVPTKELRRCIATALTYHRTKSPLR